MSAISLVGGEKLRGNVLRVINFIKRFVRSRVKMLTNLLVSVGEFDILGVAGNSI